MRVSELIEQLQKLSPNAVVYMQVTNHEVATVAAMSLETGTVNTCIIRDHFIQRPGNVFEIGGKLYEIVEHLPKLK